MNVREKIESVARRTLVNPDQDKGGPGETEDDDQNEGHDVSRISQVLRESRGVLFVVYGGPASHPPHHGEDVAVGVDDGDDRRAEDEDGEGRRVSGHVLPVEQADEGVPVEPGLVEPEQWGAAHHSRRHPGQRHPTLAPYLRLHGVIPVYIPTNT